MKRSILVSMLAIVAGFSVTSDLRAQQGRGRRNEAEVRVQQSDGFSVRERQIVAEFYAINRQEAEMLPPGIARNLARGKRLPPGIAKRQIPAELAEQFPARAGFEVSIFGDRIVLLEASGLVVDILEGILH